jgi:flagellar hook-associated protein 1 FlgK
MASIFNTLNIGYSGLVAAQVGVSTTSHNIANAESEGYTRQRVVTAAAVPISSNPGQVGNGVVITDIARIFDNFVFDKYTKISSDKEYSDFTTTTLEELSTYFPEIDEVGIKADLKEYYNLWQSFADNPDNDSIKLALSQQTQTLSQNITSTQNKILDLQSRINSQLSVNVNEVNLLAKELANLNISIEVAESGGQYSANDLRDKRNVIERSLSRLIGAEVTTGKVESNIGIDSSSYSSSGSYTLSVNGFNIVDGGTYHPINIENKDSANGFYNIAYERQDGTLIPMNERVSGGRIGAILNLRGSKIDDTTSGVPTNGILQKVVAEMDAFARGIIESTNNLYAASSTAKMQSNVLDINATTTLLNSSLNLKAGAFDIVIYDIDGNETSRRTIEINSATVMNGIAGSNSIEGQIKKQADDNGDLNANNDIDDYLQFNFDPNGNSALELTVNSFSEGQGYRFAIEDKLKTSEFNSGSNFAGALGLGRFFDGDSAKNINLNFDLRQNETKISAGSAPLSGDNGVALSMIQQQFEKYDFKVGGVSFNSTIYGIFDVVVTNVGVVTNDAILNNQTITAQFNAIEQEYSSVSKVSIDEELTNLIKYQTSYGAASKIITTIDQMMQTLLGIKQ